jgi:hypothetical protein
MKAKRSGLTDVTFITYITFITPQGMLLNAGVGRTAHPLTASA